MARNWNNGSAVTGLTQTTPNAPEPVNTPVCTAADVATAVHEVSGDPEDVTFRPSREQRKARALFYATAKSKHIDVSQGVTVDLATDVIPSYKLLPQWWHNDLFVEWFTNSNTYQTRIDYLIDLQLDNLEDVIVNREGVHTTRDQVAAGRQLAEYKKAFIDEDKAERPDMGTDMVRAIAARLMASKRLPQVCVAAPTDTGDTHDAELVSDKRVDLPL